MFSIKSNNLMNRFSLLLIISFLFISSGYSQDIVVNTASRGVYDFIDELTVSRIIDANTTVKPYSRRQIGEWLLKANGKKDELSNRQRKELDFYLKDYYKDITGYIPKKKRFDIYYYSDSNFSITVNPIIGVYAYKNGNDMAYGRYSGAEVYGRVGKSCGYYVNLRDSYESIPLRSESLLTQQRGAVTKKNKSDGSIEFNEINGGLSYSWSWGSISLAKENVEWGSGYNGTNIFSGHSPSFAMIKLKVNPVKWLDFSYFHGWLVSCVADSSTIIKGNLLKRWDYIGKYVAANMITVRPNKTFNFSIGNSVIYSGSAPRLPYLIPIMFFKSVDHMYSNLSDNSDQNTQMFVDLNIYPSKNIKLYGSFFIDELGISRMFDSKKQTNYISIKGGFELSNWPIKNIGIITEYTRTNPFTYNHWTDVQTYATNKINMGHYLRDNADEIYGKIIYRPLKNINFSFEYINSRKGPDYRLQNKYYGGYTLIEEIRWQRKAIIGSVSYQPINDLYINLSIENSNITGSDVNLYTPKFQQGKTTTVFGGISVGF
jgi:hypothetical protein